MREDVEELRLAESRFRWSVAEAGLTTEEAGDLLGFCVRADDATGRDDARRPDVLRERRMRLLTELLRLLEAREGDYGVGPWLRRRWDELDGGSVLEWLGSDPAALPALVGALRREAA